MKTMTVFLTLACALLLAAGSPAVAQVGDPEYIGALIYDDYDTDYKPAVFAAGNLQIPHETTSDPCALQEAAEDGAYSLIVVNSVLDYFSTCDGQDILPALTEYAQGDGNLVFQAWELDLCGTTSEIACTPQSVEALLGALGAQADLVTYTQPPTLATATPGACSLGINPLLPAGLDAIEPTGNPLIRIAQGVSAGDGTVCLEDGDGAAQIVVNDNGAYVGFAAPAYEGAADTTLPGPEDMVKLYENLLLSYIA